MTSAAQALGVGGDEGAGRDILTVPRLKVHNWATQSVEQAFLAVFTKTGTVVQSFCLRTVLLLWPGKG